MAGMSSNTWYSITLAPFTDPSWVASVYNATPYIVDIVASGVQMPVFCVVNYGVGSLSTVAYLGGTCDIPNDAVTIVSTLTMDTSTFSNGDTWYSIRYPVGSAWLWYSSASFAVRRLAAPTTLGAFIA
jgi:hypothetical protein